MHLTILNFQSWLEDGDGSDVQYVSDADDGVQWFLNLTRPC